MQKNQFRICLYFVVFCVSLVITLSENNSKFIKFTKESDLGGFTCPEQHAIYFKDKMSSSQCLATCADFKGCFSVFRHEESSRCIGCKDKYLTSDDAPVLLGTTFFRRRSYLVVTEKKTWFDAKSHCSELGGHLLDIMSQDEHTLVDKLRAFETDTWLGATVIKNTRIFIWENGNKVDDYFENWSSHEPNNAKGNENCVKINKANVWVDTPCYEQWSSVCEFD
ncbi:lactose-binding lectin l-2-like [Ruditapes philippinarum]|uniref:lactose-binding lectin l-2-like n=1 Tax=Ruditapes philippinarum TaxID=129788 RepID=UPI00295C2900|nr:lactose-binding lectin l-2-like [Ruditapes philippinarum]